jgi:aromatic ring-opening dioxygenase catalytic subunit (LigB family)
MIDHQHSALRPSHADPFRVGNRLPWHSVSPQQILVMSKHWYTVDEETIYSVNQ